MKDIVKVDSMNFKHKKVKSHKRNVEYLKCFALTFLYDCVVLSLGAEEFNLAQFIKKYNSAPIIDFAVIIFFRHLIAEKYENLSFDN